jgi:endonuclease YncB( thermonuclease family)
VTEFLRVVRNLALSSAVLLAVLASAGSLAADEPTVDEPTVTPITYPSFIGRVIKVASGDRLQMMLVDGRLADIQLLGLQAPDRGEPFAPQARQWLQSQLQSQIVSIDCDPKTADGPLLRCVVYPDERDVNFIALRLGIARTLATDLQSDELTMLFDAERYLAAESIARSTGLGLWAASELSSVSP